MFKRANRQSQIGLKEFGHFPGWDTIARLKSEVNDMRADILERGQRIDARLNSLSSISGQNNDTTNYDSLPQVTHPVLAAQHKTVSQAENASKAFRPGADHLLNARKIAGHDVNEDAKAANIRAAEISKCAQNIEGYNNAMQLQINDMSAFNKELAAESARQVALDAESTMLASARQHAAISAPEFSLLRAKSIPPFELVHSKFFDDISKANDISAFDIALGRIPDINKKNAQGIATMTYVAKNMFEHGIRELLKKGATTSDTFLCLFKDKLEAATQLLIRIVSATNPASYDEMFNGLIADNTVTHLVLCNTVLTPGSIARLAEILKKNKSITSLDLSGNNIGAEGAEKIGELLAENSKIVHLKLAGVKMKDDMGIDCTCDIARGLEQNTTVEDLSLQGSNIPYEGAIALAKMLQANKAMKFLDLSNNNIEDVGVFYLVSDLAGNKHLASLDISNVGMTDEGAEAVAEWLKDNISVVRFTMGGNTKLSAKGIDMINTAIQDSDAIVEFRASTIQNQDTKAADATSKKVAKNLTIFQKHITELTQMSFRPQGSDHAKELFVFYQQIVSKINSAIDEKQEEALLKNLGIVCKNLKLGLDAGGNDYAQELIGRFEEVDDG